jgi:MoxR-like ATPase
VFVVPSDVVPVRRPPVGSLGAGPVRAPADGANVTDDKDFKQLVRAEARRSGRRYTDVRSELRSPEGGGGGRGDGDGGGVGLRADGIAERFAEVVAAMETWFYGPPDASRLVALALVVPGNVLVRTAPGNGMTVLGQSVAAAIGGRLVSIDGRGGFGDDPPATWTKDDVVVIGHLDGMQPGDQAAVVQGSARAAVVLAKRHPIAERMPYPPDDETRERFLFGFDLADIDLETQRRILDQARDHTSAPHRERVVSTDELARWREAAAAVELPDDVRSAIVSVVDAARKDPVVLIGPSTVATLALAQAAAASALVDGRDSATVADVAGLLHAVFAHRIVLRTDDPGGVDAVIDRLRGTLR